MSFSGSESNGESLQMLASRSGERGGKEDAAPNPQRLGEREPGEPRSGGAGWGRSGRRSGERARGLPGESEAGGSAWTEAPASLYLSGLGWARAERSLEIRGAGRKAGVFPQVLLHT